MLKNKKDYLTIIVLNLAIVVGFVSTFIFTQNKQLEVAEVSSTQISNKKICWGIK